MADAQTVRIRHALVAVRSERVEFEIGRDVAPATRRARLREQARLARVQLDLVALVGPGGRTDRHRARLVLLVAGAADPGAAIARNRVQLDVAAEGHRGVRSRQLERSGCRAAGDDVGGAGTAAGPGSRAGCACSSAATFFSSASTCACRSTIASPCAPAGHGSSAAAPTTDHAVVLSFQRCMAAPRSACDGTGRRRCRDGTGRVQRALCIALRELFVQPCATFTRSHNVTGADRLERFGPHLRAALAGGHGDGRITLRELFAQDLTAFTGGDDLAVADGLAELGPDLVARLRRGRGRLWVTLGRFRPMSPLA